MRRKQQAARVGESVRDNPGRFWSCLDRASPRDFPHDEWAGGGHWRRALARDGFAPEENFRKRFRFARARIMATIGGV